MAQPPSHSAKHPGLHGDHQKMHRASKQLREKELMSSQPADTKKIAKATFSINMTMEIDAAAFGNKSDGIPQEALEAICKSTFLAVFGPLIQEMLDAEEKRRDKNTKLYFEKDEKSFIDGCYHSGRGIDMATLFMAQEAVASFSKKISTTETKVVYKKEQ